MTASVALPQEGLIGFGIKNSDTNNYYKAKGSLSDIEAAKKAEQYIKKYAPAEGFTYVLKNNTKKSDDVSDFYMLDYKGVASNGINTGEFVSIWINMNGDVINFAHRKGNTDLALNAKTQISKQDAEKIASDKMNAQLSPSFVIPKLVTTNELKVYKNTLVYDITISSLSRVLCN